MRGQTVERDACGVRAPLTKVSHLLRLLTVVDWNISAIFITPLVVIYWRSTWYLLDVYLIPSRPLLSGWISFGVGIAVLTLISTFQGTFKEYMYIRKEHTLAWLLVCHVYSYLAGVATIFHWRGAWMLWDTLTDTGKVSALTSIAIGWGGLVLLRSLINGIAAPLSISVDISDNFFDCSTRFRTKASAKLLFYILDTLLTTIVIFTLVVTLWRGIWTLQNDMVSPSDLTRSAMISVLLGYACVIMAIGFQYSAQSSSEAMGKDFPYILRIALQDVLVTIGILGIISVWRGIWVFMDVWLTNRPSPHVLWINHVVCIALLFLLLAGKSTFMQGCMLDGQSAEFPIFYIRYFLRNKFYQDRGDEKDIEAVETGGRYPQCSLNHYCLLLNVLRERNTERRLRNWVVLTQPTKSEERPGNDVTQAVAPATYI